MLPEKLPLNKALLELEPRNGNATDLTGDAGVACPPPLPCWASTSCGGAMQGLAPQPVARMDYLWGAMQAADVQTSCTGCCGTAELQMCARVVHL